MTDIEWTTTSLDDSHLCLWFTRIEEILRWRAEGRIEQASTPTDAVRLLVSEFPNTNLSGHLLTQESPRHGCVNRAKSPYDRPSIPDGLPF